MLPELEKVFEECDAAIDARMKGWTSLSARDDLKTDFREHAAKVVRALRYGVPVTRFSPWEWLSDQAREIEGKDG